MVHNAHGNLLHVHSTAELCDKGRAGTKAVLAHHGQLLHDVDSLFWFHLPSKITSYFMIFMAADAGLFLLNTLQMSGGRNEKYKVI